MSAAGSGAITLLLRSAAGGDEHARNRVVEIVYPEMRRIARSYFRTEPTGHTLQPTALVHEAFVRLMAGQPLGFVDRVHFYATASRQMRRVLVDYARRRQIRRSTHGEVSRGTKDERSISPLHLALLLERLAAMDPRAAQVVDLQYWGGLNQMEIAEALGVSVSTVQRDWEFARLWLAAEHGA
jgi:RNA polymerase sigma factor (TIGR02999 family)